VSPDERAIRDLVETRMKASRAGDTATVLSLMSDDVIFNASRSGRKLVENASASIEPASAVELHDRAVTLVGQGDELFQRIEFVIFIFMAVGTGRVRIGEKSLRRLGADLEPVRSCSIDRLLRSRGHPP
jgi:ketosteroid isomerase-like protein